MNFLKPKASKLLPFWLLVLLILTSAWSAAWAAETYPAAPNTNIYVSDLADILKPETEAAILDLGGQLDQQTSAQVVVVTVPNIEGQAIQDYANGLFRAWGIGQKDKNNGVLMLVSRDDRKVRIEVGYGLEGALPDSKVGRILDNQVIPFFKKGDYDSGIYSGYVNIADNVAKEYQVQLNQPPNRAIPDNPQAVQEGRTTPPSLWDRLMPFILIGMFLLDLIFNRARITRTVLEMLFWMGIFRGGRGGGGGFGGGGFGGGGFGGGSSGGGGGDRSW